MGGTLINVSHLIPATRFFYEGKTREKQGHNALSFGRLLVFPHVGEK